jgi:hypothetical protein
MNPKNVKFIVTVPTSHADTIREAIGQVGAGRIGNYDFCSFSISGVGRFKGNTESNPSIGVAGNYELVEEERIEVSVAFEIINDVIAVVKAIHPYEEVAYDVYPLMDL